MTHDPFMVEVLRAQGRLALTGQCPIAHTEELRARVVASDAPAAAAKVATLDAYLEALRARFISG